MGILPRFARSSGMTTLTINSTLVSFLLGSLIPFIHDALTKLNASDKLKSTVAIVLSLVASFVQASVLTDGSVVLSAQTLVSFFIILATGRTTYKFYDNLGLAGKILPTKGLG